jgi:hypothetical protein
MMVKQVTIGENIWVSIVVVLVAILIVSPMGGLMIFIATYGTSAFPYGDANVASANIAVKTHDGTLTLDDIFAPHNGHRIVFSRLTTVVSTLLTGWHNTYDIALNVLLGILNTILWVMLLAHVAPKNWMLFLFPTALFTLSVDQALNWLGGLQSAFHFSLLFTLLALVALQKWAHQPTKAVLTAIGCAFCASFSSANGLTAWGVIMLYMLSSTYRQIRYYAWVIGTGMICAMLFFSGNIGTGGAMGQVVIPSIGELIQYMLTMLGRPLLNDLSIAPIIGAIGIILFIIACISLWRNDQKALVALCMAITLFPIGTIGLVGITRYHFFGMHSALLEHYQQATAPFWIALIAMMIQIQKKFTWLIIIALIGIHGLMVIDDQHTLEWQVYGQNGAVIPTPLSQIAEQGDCFARFPFNPDYTCFGAYPPYDYAYTMMQVAMRGLSGYAKIPITNRLTAWTGEPIVLVADSAWEAVAKAHFWLNGVGQEAIFYIIPQGDMRIVDEQFPHLPHPPQHVLYGEADQSAQLLLDGLATADRVWYITTPIPYVGEVFVTYRGVLDSQFRFDYTLELGDGMIASLYRRLGKR